MATRLMPRAFARVVPETIPGDPSPADGASSKDWRMRSSERWADIGAPRVAASFKSRERFTLRVLSFANQVVSGPVQEKWH